MNPYSPMRPSGPSELSRFRPSWARVWMWGSTIALVRVGVLWFLIYREWTHQQSLETLPLALLLFPEGLLLPASVTWTARLALVFSGVLIAGSFLWVLLLTLVVRRGRL
jgi:hypothetical protein